MRKGWCAVVGVCALLPLAHASLRPEPWPLTVSEQSHAAAFEELMGVHHATYADVPAHVRALATFLAQPPMPLPPPILLRARFLFCEMGSAVASDQVRAAADRWLAEARVATPESARPALQLQAALCAAHVRGEDRNFAEGERFLRIADEAAVQSAEPALQVWLQLEHAMLAYAQHDANSAEQVMPAAQAKASELGFTYAVSAAAYYAGHVLRQKGDLAGARARYQLLADDAANQALPATYAGVLYALGTTYDARQEGAQAAELFQRAAGLASGVGDVLLESTASLALGNVEATRQHPQAALAALARAEAGFQAIGHRESSLHVALAQVNAALLAADLTRAEAKLVEVETSLATREPDDLSLAALRQRARLLAARKEWSAALAAQRQSVERLTEISEARQARATQRLRDVYEAAQKEAELQRAQADHQSREQVLADEARIQMLRYVLIVLAVIMAGLAAVWGVRAHRSARLNRDLALTDELTQVANRRHILQLAADAVDKAHTAATAVCLLSFDIDYFKRINDSFGHAVGDEALRRVAQAVARALRYGDSIGRTGGEEFLVVLNAVPAETAAIIAERVRATVQAISFSDLNQALRVTISLGMASLRPDEDLPALLARADTALYQAKAGGRNMVVRDSEVPA